MKTAMKVVGILLGLHMVSVCIVAVRLALFISK